MASDRANAANTVTTLAIIGPLLVVLGLVWAAAAVSDDDAGGGSPLIALLGLAVAAAGCVALLAAVVAWSVRLGIRWSGIRDEIVQGLGHSTEPAVPTYLDEDAR